MYGRVARFGDDPQRPTASVDSGSPRRFHPRDGTRWVVAVGDHRVRVADLVGMGYLAELLTHPGQEIPALALASQGSAPREQTRHELLDDTARNVYAARARELSAELAGQKSSMTRSHGPIGIHSTGLSVSGR
jgi:hypothetical protein